MLTCPPWLWTLCSEDALIKIPPMALAPAAASTDKAWVLWSKRLWSLPLHSNLCAPERPTSSAPGINEVAVASVRVQRGVCWTGAGPSSALRPFCLSLHCWASARGLVPAQRDWNPVPIKSTVTEPEGPGAADWKQCPAGALLIDSVKRLINVGCYAAGGQQASYQDRLKVTVSCATLPFLSTRI